MFESAGQRQELELHVGEADVVAGSEERACFEEVARAEAPSSQRPVGGQLGTAESAQFGRERVLVVG